ncbi:MAG: hypothetical protein K0R08_1378 [Solimicrobium sp.]|jgi:uncharacterized protein|nr:hypothetical protein [Solimicrobium sp.]
MAIIDAFAFCRNGEQQVGKLSLTELLRLRAECVSDESAIEWTLVGNDSTAIKGYPALHLTVLGSVQLMCQRCLAPYVFQVKAESTFLLAKDEQTADELDALLSGDELEVIVASKVFDVLALIEDEVMLAIPFSPKHEICPIDTPFNASVNVKKESPFAALKDRLVVDKLKS